MYWSTLRFYISSAKKLHSLDVAIKATVSMTVEYCSTSQEIKRSVSVTDHTKNVKKQTKYESSHDKADAPINANRHRLCLTSGHQIHI